LANDKKSPVTVAALESALNDLHQKIIEDARQAAVSAATRIADERRKPDGFGETAWRLMWLAPRFFSSGVFFMMSGGLLLYIAGSNVVNRHAMLTFILAVLGVAVLLYGTGTQGLGRLESTTNVAKYNIALAGGAGALAFGVAFGMIHYTDEMKQAFQVERKYLRIPVVDQSHRQLLDRYVWEFSIDGDGIPMRRRGSQLEILIPYLAGDFIIQPATRSSSSVDKKDIRRAAITPPEPCLSLENNRQDAHPIRIMATYQVKHDKIKEGEYSISSSSLTDGETKEYQVFITHSFEVAEANAEFPQYPESLCIDFNSAPRAVADSTKAGARALEKARDAPEQATPPVSAAIPTGGTE
jgi:hypothetical protein